MARTLMFSYNGEISSFSFAKVDRRKLYGTRRRMALDPEGRPALRGSLTHDGSLVLQQGMTAQGYFDEEGRWWPNGDLVGLDDDGTELPRIPSTLGREVELTGPEPASALLDLRVRAVYALDPDEETGLSPALKAALDDGQLFRFPFSYRGGYREDEGWLVANDTGVYALIGGSVSPNWCELQVAVAADEIDDDEDLGDELDFEMF